MCFKPISKRIQAKKIVLGNLTGGLLPAQDRFKPSALSAIPLGKTHDQVDLAHRTGFEASCFRSPASGAPVVPPPVPARRVPSVAGCRLGDLLAPIRDYRLGTAAAVDEHDMKTMKVPLLFLLVAATAASPARTTSLRPIHLEPREGRPHAFVTDQGREVIFHGTAAVVKGPPWYPDHTEFSSDISMAREDFEWMQKLGLNFLRLGLMWPGVEPVRGQYNETYLDQIDAIVSLAGEHGVYVVLDAHQDGLSEFFCGEGWPHWAVRRVGDAPDVPFLRDPFPAPYSAFVNGSSSCGNASCFYSEPQYGGAAIPTRHACDAHKHGLGWGETTFETAQAYQGFWDNWNGTGDAFASMWAHVARRFKGRPEMLGYELLNEPFAGDPYENPLIMVPYPNPWNADRVNMQPTYAKVNDAIRSAGGDQESLLFVAGMTWGDFGAGFSEAPGGEEYANRTVVAYHYYEPPQVTAEAQVRSHSIHGKRLGTGVMVTETEAIWAGSYKHRGANLTDACDTHLTGWADWEWKSFVREGETHSPESQYFEWGAPKTGHGRNWNGKDDPPAYYATHLARTYAPRVVGAHVKMHFNHTSSDFELQYDVGAVDDADLPTEIFVWPGRYPGGAVVTASASAGGSVRVEYDGKGSWVKVFPASGLVVGARVTVKIAKKPSLAGGAV